MGIVVVVDALSGLVGARPIKSKAQIEISRKTREILNWMKGHIKLKGGQFQTDGGNEFQNPGAQEAGIFTTMVHSFGMKYY